jgi:proline dehydrogenase
MSLRPALLYLSRQRAVRKWMETSPLARRMSSRFIAGSTLEEAIDVCGKLRAEGIAATLDYLGENVRSLAEAAASRDMCRRVLDAMHAAGVEPNVSIKLTQFGLDFSAEACEDNVAPLVEAASAIGGLVRIDMESSEYTARTLGIVTRLHQRYGSCGTVIQAYLRSSAADADYLAGRRIPVRLCKGAYLEGPDVAFESKAEVDRNYLELAKKLLIGGCHPAIATHDERMIEAVERFAAQETIGKDAFEFQMLFGIRRDLQQRLVADGYRLRLYVPFGEAWYPYFMRRLAERPANLLFLARNLIRR